MSLTINVTYYNEPKWLLRWCEFAKRLQDNSLDVTVTICDDGSQDARASEVMKQQPVSNMKLYRVIKDIGFNSHGCRNLLMKETETDWNVLVDIDRTITFGTIERLLTDNLKRKHYYAFFGKHGKFSLNDYTMHRDDFWEGGGYDETFVNCHFGDRMMFENYFNKELIRVESHRYLISYDRGARNVRLSKDDLLTGYPDDDTLIVPQYHWWRDPYIRKRIEHAASKRYTDPVARKKKPVVQFDWERVI